MSVVSLLRLFLFLKAGYPYWLRSRFIAVFNQLWRHSQLTCNCRSFPCGVFVGQQILCPFHRNIGPSMPELYSWSSLFPPPFTMLSEISMVPSKPTLETLPMLRPVHLQHLAAARKNVCSTLVFELNNIEATNVLRKEPTLQLNHLQYKWVTG